jgi:molecular chaperone DnaJ
MSRGWVFSLLRRQPLRQLGPATVRTDGFLILVEAGETKGRCLMVRKDYYLILGVPYEESSRGIQAAFRELAKRYHPDRAGTQRTNRFQDIQEAYEILSDAQKRQLYNDELGLRETSKQHRPEPVFSRSPQFTSEPLIPKSRSVLRGFETIRPSFESLFDRFVRNFTGEEIPKGERLESLNVEVIISLDEAAWGVTVPVGVPVFYTCRQCGGSGHVSLFPCLTCDTQGIVEGEETITVRIPPIATDRAIFELPIHGLGIHNFYLRLHTRISR